MVSLWSVSFPVQLELRNGVKVKSVDLRINLESLSFHLENEESMPV